MFYIDELKKQIAKAAANLAAAVAHIDSPEFEKELERVYQDSSTRQAAKLGYLIGSIRAGTQTELATAAMCAENAAPDIAWGERCAALCGALSIDDDNMAALELLTTDPRYRSEYGDLCERIMEAAGEIISDTREREHDDAIKALEAAGFVAVERDDFDGWERTGQTPGIVERATVETKHRGNEFWYEFTLEVNGIESMRGKSGEFQKLLEAVGIKQEVKG